MKASFLYVVMILMISVCFFSSCSFEKIGRDLTKGVSSQTDSIGRTLVAGAMNELTNPNTRRKVSLLLDSILTAFSDSLTVRTRTMEDSLLNRKVLLWADTLMQTLTGSRMRMNLDSIQGVVVGKTKRDVLVMRDGFSQLLAEILGNNTKNRLGLMRDELLGSKTSAALVKIIDTAVTHIVDSAMHKVSEGFRNDINPQLTKDISFVNRNAIWLLVTLGAIAAAIIFLVWQNRKKYLRMVAIIAKQVHDIPDQKVYDLVTARIKQNSVASGLEPDLRKLLSKNGLIDDSSWKKDATK
ncbi:MAG TPA: hypothetical protein VGM31_02935 [Puia sp.]